jgi:hypothetical protein
MAAAQATGMQLRLDTLGENPIRRQLVGARGAEIAKGVDTYAVALHHGMAVGAMSDLDLSYTPRWDAVELATQDCSRQLGTAAAPVS